MFDAHNFDVVGRLKPGITLAQANAELNTIQQSIRKQHPQGPVSDATSLRPLLDAETYTVKTSLYTLLAATGCLLLIACLNIANLLVARALTRRRETAIRTALGSTRSRLIRQQVMESLLLSCAGGLFGFLLAAASLQWLVHARQDIPRAESIHIDAIVVIFTTILILICGLLAGLIPALSSDDKHILQALHQSSRSYSGGRSGMQLRRTLLSVQVGLTVVLLIGAGLLIKSYSQLRSVNLGCATQNVLTMRFKLPKNTAQNISSFHQQLLAQVRSQPGVKAAGIVTFLPAEGHQKDDVFRIAEHPPLQPGKVLSATTRFADPGYFSAMQIPLLYGQFFRTALPTDPQQQVVISQEFARIYFPNEDPIGKHVISAVTDDEATYEIVGVVADTLEEVSNKPSPTIYYPILMGSERFGALTIRAVPGQDALTLALPIQKVIAGIDRDLPVSRVLTMDQIIGQSTLGASFNATLLLAFAIISLILATVGLFGVLTYIITQRTTEIGVRLALGSTRQQVMHLMLRDGLRPALTGLALGLLASIGVTRLIRSMLFATTGLDPAVYVIVTITLLMAATLACVIPAWRASRLDPVVALRAE
jgi:predicted permease